MDLLPGPSELLVLADAAANPACIAADLLAQAEHGSGHERVWLLTDSDRVLRAAQREITRQLPKRARRESIGRVLAAGTWLVRVENLDEAVALANQLAPEHLELMCRDARRVTRRLLTAGAIFAGGDTPTVLGDYVAGPSHVLPAGGSGASFAGLTVDQFQRRTSIVAYTKAALRKAMPAVRTFAEMEGLEAHGWSARIRLGARR
jgi:histidinol dehydrogenase